MNERQKNLLQFIIEEYTQSAEPVGSKLIAGKYFKDLSGATVRNEMQALEEQGLITHPHTSAGRIPTEHGYRFYLQDLLVVQELAAGKKRSLEGAGASALGEEKIKALAKKTAELTMETVVVGFAPNDVFYTGLANLFSQPEFSQQETVINISQVIDHLDAVMAKIQNRLDADISVLLGSDNPFGPDCGSVLSLVKFGRGRGVVGILGPMRMDYSSNIAYVKFVRELIEE